MREGDRMDLLPHADDPSARAGVGVPRNLLREAVFVRLLVSILRGEYRPGQRLRLDEIALHMRVSRTPVREALVPLESLRLVVVQRYVGVVIAHWTIDHMVERLRIIGSMLVRAAQAQQSAEHGRPVGTPRVADPFLRPVSDHVSEAGIACDVAEWVLRQDGCPVGADWAGSMRPLLDTVFSPDVALVHGVHVSNERRQRQELAERAVASAAAGDVDGARSTVAELLERLAALPGRFRPQQIAS
jgi:hypothetical protein